MHAHSHSPVHVVQLAEGTWGDQCLEWPEAREPAEGPERNWKVRASERKTEQCHWRGGWKRFPEGRGLCAAQRESWFRQRLHKGAHTTRGKMREKPDRHCGPQMTKSSDCCCREPVSPASLRGSYRVRSSDQCNLWRNHIYILIKPVALPYKLQQV